MARVRVSGHGVEVIFPLDSTQLRVAQHGVEMIYAYTAASPTTVTGAGVSQHGVEVLYIPPSRSEVSQHGIEVIFQEGADVDAGTTQGTVSYGSVT